jgi:hypothetical protein
MVEDAMRAVRDAGAKTGIVGNETPCTTPNVVALLESSRKALQYEGLSFPSVSAKELTLGSGANTEQWIGVRWDGPTEGAVFVLDCVGHTLALTRVGGVESIAGGPELPEIGKTVVVQSVGFGTGVEEHVVEIYAYRDGALVQLWKHSAHEHAFLSLDWDGHDDKYSWRFEREGALIRVTGQLSTYPKAAPGRDDWGKPQTVDAPVEAFCWTPKNRAFEACTAAAH